MRSEIRVPRLGEVRIGDVRVAVGSGFATAPYVDVLVLGQVGQRAFAGRLHFVDKPSGRGMHRQFACPACLEPRGVLFVDGNGGIGCRRCTSRRTRRQLERTCRAFRRGGGSQEDELLRVVTGSARKPERAQALACSMIEADRARWAALQPDIQMALDIGRADHGKKK